ncbi:MAG: hypothetical protein ACI8RD_008533, partial [Bacillariaceae sp.]|jgi:hypothetical protein
VSGHISPNIDFDKPSQAMRFGNHLKEGETQIAPNMILRYDGTNGWEKRMFNSFFVEFGVHFGNKLTAIKTFTEMDAVEHVSRTATKQQCKNSPVYCADVTGDVIQIRTKLEMLIEEGEVLKP